MGAGRGRQRTWSWQRTLLAIAAVGVWGAAAPVAPATAGLGLSKVGSFVQPVHLAAPPGERRHFFVLERLGRVWVVRDGRRLRRPFLDIRRAVEFQDVRDIGNDQGGVLAIAFSPGYQRTGRFYLLYTRRDGRIHLDEFRRSRRAPDRALAATRRTVLSLPRRSGDDLGGGLAFGPDGLLYVGLGQGPDPTSAQRLSALTGKILRIDPRPGAGTPYRVPSDNPFVMTPGARPEVWAYGLRMPWRISFDPRSRALVVGEVGEERVEEIDVLTRAGLNLGWPLFEGRLRHSAGSVPESLLRPALERRHRRGKACAIVGGYVVRSSGPRRLRGRYLYGDLCSAELRSVRLRGSRAIGDRSERVRVMPGLLSSFGRDGRGRLYAISLYGPVYRIVER